MFNTPAVNDNQLKENVLLPFFFENGSVHGKFIRLGSTVNRILHNHHYPEPISLLLGEMLTLVALIGSSLNIKGIISLQLHCKGPLQFMVADYTSEGHLRGYAKIRENQSAEEKELLTHGTLKPAMLLTEGHLTISVDIEGTKERYQGTVGLKGNSLADCVTEYFQQSVQRKAAFIIAMEKSKKNSTQPSYCVGGIMLQCTPAYGNASLTLVPQEEKREQQEIAWDHAVILMRTTTVPELTDTHFSPTTVLFRLFHEEKVHIQRQIRLRARCRCSRKKVKDILLQLTPEERHDLQNEQGEMHVKCEFCAKTEVFTQKDFL